MTRDERALWALEVFGGIDAALIEEAERKAAGPSRWPRVAAVLAAVLALSAAFGMAMVRRETPTVPPDTTAAPTTTGHVHAPSTGTVAMQIAHVRWQEVFYALEHDADAVVGEQIGVVEFCSYLSCMEALPKDDPRWTDRSSTASNIIPVGAPIYACAGYPTAWRICAYDERGELCVFVRSWVVGSGETLTGRAVGELFPALSEVRQIDLYGENFLQAEITDPAVISALLTSFCEAVFIAEEEGRDVAAADSRRLTICLADGTTTEIWLGDNGIGHWLGYVRIPEGLYEAVAAQAIFSGGSADDLDLAYGGNEVGVHSAYNGLKNYTDYYLGLVWLDGTNLCMGMRKEDGHYIVLADDAAGDIVIEGIDIFYRTLSGEAARIRYWYPRSQGDFYSELGKGVDMTDYITVREIVDTGPYVRMQMRLGVRWTLDAEGRLARNGEVVAEEVRDFMLIAADTVWAAGNGAFRRTEDGSVLQLTAEPTKAIRSTGLYVHYATDAGELHRIRCDGMQDVLIGRIDCVKLIPAQVNGSAEEAMAILTADGRACLLMGGMLYTVAEGVADIGTNDITLTLTMADGRMLHGQLDYFAEPDAEHNDPAGLQFAGVPVTNFTRPA
ncbi:MAG: hypothetical protein IJC15_00170 [Clostridia bacterium]|nr:hypothetical protein [Clostridia bacterium]